MEELDFIYKRKSVRQFMQQPVPKADLEAMLQAATYAPSPKHQQNWHFVIVQNERVIQEIATIVRTSHEAIGQLAQNEKDFKRHMSVVNYYTCFKDAPVVIFVYGCEYRMIEETILRANQAPQAVIDVLRSPQSGAQAIGAAVENFLLAATALGYGSCYLTGPTHAKTAIEEKLNFTKPGYELMAMIAVGKALEPTAAQPARKPLAEVVTFLD